MRIHVIGDSVSEGAGAEPLRDRLPPNVHFASRSGPRGWVSYLSILLASSFHNQSIHVNNLAIGGQGPSYFWHCSPQIDGEYNAILFQTVRPGGGTPWDKLLTHYKNAILVDYRNPAFHTMNKSKLQPGLTIVDATDIFVTDRKDDFNPTDKGHREIAHRVHQLLISQDWSLVMQHQHERPVLCLNADTMEPAAGAVNDFQLRRWSNDHGAGKTSWQAWHEGDSVTFLLPHNIQSIGVNAYMRANMSSFEMIVPANYSTKRNAQRHTTAREYWWLPAGRGLDVQLLVELRKFPRGMPYTIVNRCARTCELQITGILLTLDSTA